MQASSALPTSWVSAVAGLGRLDGAAFVRRAHLRSLSRQLPLLYAALCTNALAVVWTHLDEAPAWLTLVVPAIVLPCVVLRVLYWLRLDVDALDDDQVEALLRRSVRLVAVLGALFTIWSHGMFAYGDVYSQLHVLFFMSTTSVGCIFCLVHLRPAALILSATVVVPFALRFGTSGNDALLAISVNLVIVTVVMILMMQSYHEHFRRQVLQAEDLAVLGEARRVAAETDMLTGLANRRRFFEEFDGDIAGGRPFALGLVDLDGFKPVNDRFGHAAGDIALVETACRLRAFAADATMARLGGDEFGLIVRGDALHDLPGLGARIADALGRPIALPNESVAVQVAASMGFALYPVMGRTQEQLLERADCALYHAKNHCRGTAVVFTDGHADAARERRRVEEELGRADLEAELSLCFQPIVDVARGRTVAFEALARWTSPELGPVSPAVFVPIAERLGLVRQLTDILFRKACRAAQAWPDDVQLSFNLSVHDLFGDAPLERLTRLVGESGLPCRRIIVEITEGVMMRDFEAGSDVLQGLRDLGCEVALDDFGTGYSSLSYVHRLPLDRLKIDQSFVRSMTSDRTSRAIVQSILGLSATLGVQCVVEGVETAAETSLLEGMGVRWMQGYHFGRPMTAEDAIAHLGEASLGSLASMLAELDRDGQEADPAQAGSWPSAA